MSRVRKGLATLKHRLEAEAGSALIEVVVSAAVLLTAGGGIVLTLQTADAQSGQQRHRAVAANVATGEIERLRSLKFDDLVGLNATTTENVDGIEYTIQSTSGWALATDTRASGCLESSRSPQQLRVSARVSWPNMGPRAPVSISSILAAPAGANRARGALTVQVTNREGFGVADLPISLDGPSPSSSVTDANGCVKFNDLVPAADYRIRFSRPGWSTPEGDTDVDAGVDIVAGQTQTRSFQYDSEGTASASFETQTAPGATPPAVVKASTVLGLTWTHPSAITPPAMVQDLSPAVAATATSPPLPFSSSPYGVYADVCTTADPGAAAPQPQTVTVPNGSVTVRLPALHLRLMVNGAPMGGAQVVARTPCATRYVRTTGADGYLTDPGLPYAATLQTCVGATLPGVGTYRVTFNVPNTTWPGTARTLSVNTSTGVVTLNPGNQVLTPVAGACP